MIQFVSSLSELNLIVYWRTQNFLSWSQERLPAEFKHIIKRRTRN